MFSPLSHSWLFSTNHGSCSGLLGLWSSVTCSHVPIHWASITSSEIPIKSGHNTCKKGKNRQLLTLLSCFLHYIHSLKTCVASLLHRNVQVENFQTCKSAFGCAIISVRSQIWHTLSWINPRQVCVHLYTLLYRTVWSTIVQDFISRLRCLKGSINAVVM